MRNNIKGIPIKKQDFLKLDLSYNKLRLIIMGPPFGIQNKLAIKFLEKGFKLSDHVVAILPITLMNWTIRFYKKDWKIRGQIPLYDFPFNDGRGNVKNLNCCLVFYSKIKDGEQPDLQPTKKPIEGIKIITYNKHKYENLKNYDLELIVLGDKNKIGKNIKGANIVCKRTCKIKINDKIEQKKEIIKFLSNNGWIETSLQASGRCELYKWKINEALRKEFPNIDNQIINKVEEPKMEKKSLGEKVKSLFLEGHNKDEIIDAVELQNCKIQKENLTIEYNNKLTEINNKITGLENKLEDKINNQNIEITSVKKYLNKRGRNGIYENFMEIMQKNSKNINSLKDIDKFINFSNNDQRNNFIYNYLKNKNNELYQKFLNNKKINFYHK